MVALKNLYIFGVVGGVLMKFFGFCFSLLALFSITNAESAGTGDTNGTLPACAALLLTPGQIEGPFYPGYGLFKRNSNDLSNGMQATGETVVFAGRVLDRNGNPVAGAVLHLWQTDGLAGKYRHPRDPEQHLVDPKFNSWGETVTAADGTYSFRTVRPIAYPADENWMRPDHFHLMVYVSGRPVLTTQMYFSDDQWLGQDLIFQRLSEAQKRAVLITLQGAEFSWLGIEPSRHVSLGFFDVVLDLP